MLFRPPAIRRSRRPATRGLPGLLLLLGCLALFLAAGAARAQEAGDLRPLVDALGQGGFDFDKTETAIGSLAETGDPRVVPALEALSEGDLYVRKADHAVFIGKRGGAGYQLTDPLTGEAAGEAARGAVDKIRVNNNLRRAIRTALGGLTLRSRDPAQRRAAVQSVFDAADPEALEPLEAALAAEKDPGIAELMREARARILLNTPSADAGDRLDAVETLRARGDRDALAALSGLVAAPDGKVDPALRAAAAKAAGAIKENLALWEAAQNVWYGLSLGSVLLLAAIGLAITFGVMGVINMAHGEMVMLGAYTTFVVQQAIRGWAPELFAWSLWIALPLAFLVSAAVGAAIERCVIRFLYGRPLETLLATWGLSLMLQQAVRTLFGPTNKEVGAPDWMSGATHVGGLLITYNRLYIVIFALLVFAALLVLLKRSAFGLQMRAVTQNRRMAASMGIRTPWTDMLTFALGSGIAGIAGVALSQIDNVSPNLGQGYIIDSFMVVVFGGVGNLWGTLVGAFTLGIVNKFLEPYAGAVLGKVLVLVFIILFIQKRPRGLFALKGRAVDQ
ncbi:amino acid/amide ABC transporter membrane protein 1, HAAT family [Tistlia consotensis]|uniref:Amino acid/amide ABC transporter membrane protein 1, HAAT family n=1 Tax=Tistlia consotensis USBA 355 TaxID=560819 RepID=A0A1Y6BE11_9PROT|nr:urea ABC transporter permease subunit UrtB [Tistlia consotensis]SMF02664.1 amino acid/amide ABC transporter membrane protein 1, HAAT family [Tistlia consotensis USBA 355]SNR52961.1 amino acid/amide ABC transporter membrane protein 1, HAAT family [Tistlia consotensis]